MSKKLLSIVIEDGKMVVKYDRDIHLLPSTPIEANGPNILLLIAFALSAGDKREARKILEKAMTTLWAYLRTGVMPMELPSIDEEV